MIFVDIFRLESIKLSITLQSTIKKYFAIKMHCPEPRKQNKDYSQLKNVLKICHWYKKIFMPHIKYSKKETVS